MYGSGPQKVADTVGYSLEEAKEDIETYFKQFPKLKKWLATKKDEITQQGFIYSALGRKRRLKNVFSSDKGLASHEVRSGINFLIQSVASDVNLMAATEMNNYIRDTGMDARIFMLVHDSIVAEVREDQVVQYCNMLKTFTQKDRGVTGGAKVPIGVDQEVHQDYSFGKFDKVYGEAINEWFITKAASNF